GQLQRKMEEENAGVPNTGKKHDSETAADLERVTDYAEEQEIKLDIENAFQLIGEKRQQELNKKARRELELAKVKVNKEDIELIANEMEISKAVAEKNLRENGGDVVKALSVLVNG
ncbi:uncharacterized protein TRIADDRAFT_23390, partial [Trichoplax adhaerens]